jgi:nucleoside-diphosphate-sugar epimerase
MTILVTGASGLIGRHVVEHLVKRGQTVRTFQRSAPLDPRVEHIAGDVCTDRAALCAAARGCQTVIHLAGRGDVGESRRDPVGYAQLNATGALHALDAAHHADAAFVLASSQRVYPLRAEACREDDGLQPDSPYGYAKHVAELWCQMYAAQFGARTTVLRFFSVYGPGQQANGGSGVVTIFARAALAGQPLVVQSAGRRDFTDATDVAVALCLAVERAPASYRVYNIATGVGTTFGRLAEELVELSGSRSRIEERLSEPAGRDLVADISRAEQELGYQPSVSLQAGLERYVGWLRQNSA